MIYNLLTEITDYDGSIIENDLASNESERGKPLNYRQVIYTALKTPTQNLLYTPDQMVMADAILRKAYDSQTGEIELSTDEVCLIINRIKVIFLTSRIPIESDKFFNQK